MRGLVIPLISAIAFFTLSLAGALITALARDRGIGDLGSFALWSIPAALLMLAAARILSRVASRSSLLAAYAIHSTVGAIGGYCWTYFVAMSLGAWFRAFSLPVVYLWTLSGSVALVASVAFSRRSGWVLACAVVAIPVVGLLALQRASPRRLPDAVVTLRTGASEKDRKAVLETVICRPSPPREGHRPLPGIASIGGWDVGGRKRYKISFHRGLDEHRRDEIIREILESSLVDSVEDFVPPK